MKAAIRDSDHSSSRVCFQNKEFRDFLFALLKEKLGTWKEVARHFGLYKSRLERLRSGEFSIPLETFYQFLDTVGQGNRRKILQDTCLLDGNWGRSKGGLSTYARHKWIFEKGRKAERKAAWRVEDRLNVSLDRGLCEFIGAFIGDGFAGRYGNHYIVQITGHKVLDRQYYESILVPIVKSLSPSLNPRLTDTSDALRLTVNSKQLYFLLTQRFGFSSGRKAYDVVIPEEITASYDQALINACIRGIFDTDGCVGFDKRSAYLRPYIRIVLNMVSRSLVNQVHGLLLAQGIGATITRNSKVIQINGLERCKAFVEKVGFSNSRHLLKVRGAGL